MQNPPQQNTSRNNWKQRHHDIDNIHCICGNILLQTTTTHIYENKDFVLCDNCLMEIKPNDTIWHCPKGINCMLHRYNYDLCCNCALKQLSSTNRYQQSKIHLRTFDARWNHQSSNTTYIQLIPFHNKIPTISHQIIHYKLFSPPNLYPLMIAYKQSSTHSATICSNSTNITCYITATKIFTTNFSIITKHSITNLSLNQQILHTHTMHKAFF